LDLYHISHSNSKCECDPESYRKHDPYTEYDLHPFTDPYTEYDLHPFTDIHTERYTHRIGNSHNHANADQFGDQNRIAYPNNKSNIYGNSDIHTSRARADYSADYEYGQGLFA
jgi:hypothetical protein